MDSDQDSNDIVNRSQYKDAVEKEKSKLFRQVVFMIIVSAGICASFYFTLYEIDTSTIPQTQL